MNTLKTSRKSIGTLVLAFIPFFAFSSGDSSGKIIRLFADGGLLLNRSFSHFQNSSNYSRLSGNGSKISSISSGKDLLPGFYLGVSAAISRSGRNSFVFGLSYSNSQAYYNFYSRSSYEEWNTYTVTTINSKIRTVNEYLNFEWGYRLNPGGNFFLQLSLLFNKNLYVREKENGIKTRTEASAYLPGPGAPPNYRRENSEEVHSNRSYHGSNRASIRLAFFYHLKFKSRIWQLSAFRNVGISYKIPWWGIGVGMRIY